MKKTAFHEANLRYGAQMREMFGYDLPWEYGTGHEQEHIGTRQAASLCDLGYMGIFTITGPDALRLAQRLFTRDIGNLADGHIRYTAMCNTKGLMMDDGTVWKLGPERFMFISGDEGDVDWISENADGMDVVVRNITAEHTTLALQGPRSKQVLSRITDADLDSMGYYTFTPGDVAGVKSVVARIGYTGEFGYEIHIDPRDADTMWDAVMQAGSDCGIVPCGQAALESLRQEAGYLLVGNDHDKTRNPFEAGIGWVVSVHKGDFNGRDALLDILRNGIDKTLVWFKLPGGETPNTGDGIFFENQQIGSVTSGSYSPTAQAGTAMGYVSIRHATAHAPYQIAVNGKKCDARLSLMSLYDPGNMRSKG